MQPGEEWECPGSGCFFCVCVFKFSITWKVENYRPQSRLTRPASSSDNAVVMLQHLSSILPCPAMVGWCDYFVWAIVAMVKQSLNTGASSINLFFICCPLCRRDRSVPTRLLIPLTSWLIVTLIISHGEVKMFAFIPCLLRCFVMFSPSKPNK